MPWTFLTSWKEMDSPWLTPANLDKRLWWHCLASCRAVCWAVTQNLVPCDSQGILGSATYSSHHHLINGFLSVWTSEVDVEAEESRTVGCGGWDGTQGTEEDAVGSQERMTSDCISVKNCSMSAGITSHTVWATSRLLPAGKCWRDGHAWALSSTRDVGMNLC